MACPFSNPRHSVSVPNWPAGTKRGEVQYATATFQVEFKPSKGYRVIKTVVGKPKVSTFGGRVAIVDGCDGKTYIIQRSQYSEAIYVYRHDFKHPTKEELAGLGLNDYVISHDVCNIWYNDAKTLINDAHHLATEEVTDHGTLVAFDKNLSREETNDWIG